MLNKKYAYRLEFMMVTGFLVILILIGRMFYLQIIKGSTYRRQAKGTGPAIPGSWPPGHYL